MKTGGPPWWSLLLYVRGPSQPKHAVKRSLCVHRRCEWFRPTESVRWHSAPNYGHRVRSNGLNYNWCSMAVSLVINMSGYNTPPPDGWAAENDYKNLGSPKSAFHQGLERRARHAVSARSTLDLCGSLRVCCSSTAQEAFYDQRYTGTHEPVLDFRYVPRGPISFSIPSPCG